MNFNYDMGGGIRYDSDEYKNIINMHENEDGGAGSGNFGHAGRPGQRGGSAGGSGSSSGSSGSLSDERKKDMVKEYAKASQNVLSSSAEKKMTDLEKEAAEAGYEFHQTNETQANMSHSLSSPKYELRKKENSSSSNKSTEVENVRDMISSGLGSHFTDEERTERINNLAKDVIKNPSDYEGQENSLKSVADFMESHNSNDRFPDVESFKNVIGKKKSSKSSGKTPKSYKGMDIDKHMNGFTVNIEGDEVYGESIDEIKSIIDDYQKNS